MCLHTLHFFTFPPSWKEGGQGDGAVPHYGACKRGSPEGSTPTGRRYGGCASIHYTSSLSPLPGRKGARGMVRSRTTVRTSGESRGEHPHWQAVWRMCLHTLHFFTSPFLEGRGPGGWCGQGERSPKRGSPEGSTPTGRRYGGCASSTTEAVVVVQAGSPEGSTPTGRRYGGCASIHYTSSHFRGMVRPLPGRKGARGMVRSRTTVRAPSA